MKVLKWLLIGAVALVVLAVGHSIWVVETFDTDRLPVNHGRVVSELFLAESGEGDRRQPLIVTFGGAEGGNVWATPRLRAQRERFHSLGFAVLAIGYFGMPGTPADLDRISLDAVNEEIGRVASDERIDRHCVALIGGSRGAELALLLSSHFSGIDVTVAIVPPSAVFPALNMAMVTPGFSLHDHSLPFVPVPWSATPALISGDHRAAFEAMMEDDSAMRRAAIPVELMKGPVLLVSATQDEMWPSSEMAEQVVARLRQHRFRHAVEHVAIAGDHSSPLDHFDVIERFLAAHLSPRSNPGCRASDEASDELSTE